ncbi:esterase-like activity of phytase family protein [Sphingomonas cavernae]|nr:esterase-like activity of phytase family protein [Sphingomonas cavernae]
MRHPTPNVPYTIERLAWSDAILGEIALAGEIVTLRSGFGSGLAIRAGGPAGHIWAVGDRGPNLKIEVAVKRYGLRALNKLAKLKGAKIMPRVDIGPALAELRVSDGAVEILRTIRLVSDDDVPVSGLPMPSSNDLLAEPVFDLAGRPLPADPNGLDSEGIVAMRDGSFWVADEFAPSLVRVDAQGSIRRRLVPANCSVNGMSAAENVLPAIASRRQLNRGFEGLTLSRDEKWLFLAFQSPLAHPDEAAHKRARHVRLWQLDAASGAVAAQYLYPLDPPETFRRDRARGGFAREDIKVSEIVWIDDHALLVLERGSETTKIYRCDFSSALALPPEHLEIETRPTVEQLSAGPDQFPLPVLAKTLLLSSDDMPELVADMEGMAIVSPTELLLVNDNDFGVEGAETSFWKVTFDAPVLQ